MHSTWLDSNRKLYHHQWVQFRSLAFSCKLLSLPHRYLLQRAARNLEFTHRTRAPPSLTIAILGIHLQFPATLANYSSSLWLFRPEKCSFSISTTATPHHTISTLSFQVKATGIGNMPHASPSIQVSTPLYNMPAFVHSPELLETHYILSRIVVMIW